MIEENKALIRQYLAALNGIHRDDFMGIPPTSKEVTISGMLIYQIVNSKIIDYWMNFDNLGLMEQLDFIPKKL